jgi:hypothetical protein
MEKVCCYVDETGQDPVSDFFIIVAVVIIQDPWALREKLIELEQQTRTNGLKWHKTQHGRRMRYLSLAVERKIAAGSVYFSRYPKPIPYFFPMVDLITRAVKQTAQGRYRASICVDGIDRKKAKELTTALRIRGIALRRVKSARDDSEPLIRLADMWAGCLRSALLNRPDTQGLIERAKNERYLLELQS